MCIRDRREGTQEYFASVYPIWEEHQIRGSISIVTSLVQFEKRESEAHICLLYTSVSLSWVVLGVFGAVPFVITGEIPFYINALFEICLLYTSRCV